MLEALGLDKTAELVYLAMVADPGCTVKELAEALVLPETRVREALDTLVDLDLLRTSYDLPGRFRVVSPEVGLEAIITRQERELARRQHELALSRSVAAQAIAQFARSRSAQAGGIERLVGLDALQAKLEVLAKGLVKERLAVMPGAPLVTVLEAARAMDREALERGVALQTLCQDSARKDPAAIGYMEWLAGSGGEVRTAPLLPPLMLIYDRKTAVIPIDPADTRSGALCVREPEVVATLVATFEASWIAAVPISTEPGAGQAGLTPSERSLLKLLATGITDQAAAKRLGVSLRTVRRHMSALMERLGAGSRFEAGLKAARSGWL